MSASVITVFLAKMGAAIGGGMVAGIGVIASASVAVGSVIGYLVGKK